MISTDIFIIHRYSLKQNTLYNRHISLTSESMFSYKKISFYVILTVCYRLFSAKTVNLGSTHLFRAEE